MTAGSPKRLAIDGELGIFAAQAIKERLQAALAQGGEIEIDLAGVSEMDSAGVQLLVAAKKAANARQLSLRFTGHSAAVLDILDLCDLAGYFGDPVLIPRSGEEKA